MRQTLYFAFTFLMLVGCTTSESEMLLTGNISGLKKGSLLLQKVSDTALVTLDSVKIDGDATFQFNVEVASPEVYYLTMQFADSVKTEKRIPFFAESGNINIVSELKNYDIESLITGSVNQEKWNEYKKLMKRYNDRNLDLIEQQFNALKDGNQAKADSVGSAQEKLVRSRYLATVNFAKNQKEYEIAPYLMISEVNDANIKYHDTIYKLLAPKIKDSKYGKALESLIENRKND